MGHDIRIKVQEVLIWNEMQRVIVYLFGKTIVSSNIFLGRLYII
jgi:hypothetical protein